MQQQPTEPAPLDETRRAIARSLLVAARRGRAIRKARDRTAPTAADPPKNDFLSAG